MFAEKPMQLKNAGEHFQLELPLVAFTSDQDCDTLCNRVIRICDHYFPALSEA